MLQAGRPAFAPQGFRDVCEPCQPSLRADAGGGDSYLLPRHAPAPQRPAQRRSLLNGWLRHLFQAPVTQLLNKMGGWLRNPCQALFRSPTIPTECCPSGNIITHIMVSTTVPEGRRLLLRCPCHHMPAECHVWPNGHATSHAAMEYHASKPPEFGVPRRDLGNPALLLPAIQCCS